MNKKFIKISLLALVILLGILVFIYSNNKIERQAEVNQSVATDQQVNNIEEENPLDKGSEQSLVAQYIRDNIAALSTVEPVLGGTWYVTNVDFIENNDGRIFYEDGHIAQQATFSYVIDGESVDVYNFYVTPEEVEEPENSLEPEVMMEPEANLGPEPNFEADANINPDITLEPEMTIEPEANLEPETSLEPGLEEVVFCTMDAMMCADGSYVGRVAPNCEFAPCPGE